MKYGNEINEQFRFGKIHGNESMDSTSYYGLSDHTP